jgi:hypothetical protein
MAVITKAILDALVTDKGMILNSDSITIAIEIINGIVLPI